MSYYYLFQDIDRKSPIIVQKRGTFLESRKRKLKEMNEVTELPLQVQLLLKVRLIDVLMMYILYVY
jgi:hypothetical protein